MSSKTKNDGNNNTNNKSSKKTTMKHEIATWSMMMPSSSPSFPNNAADNIGKKNSESTNTNGIITLCRDGVKVTNVTSLSEGENWVVVCSRSSSLASNNDNGGIKLSNKEERSEETNNNTPLHTSIVKSYRKLYLDYDGHIKGVDGGRTNVPPQSDGTEESFLADNNSNVRTTNKYGDGSIAVLCIDVDDKGHCVTIKDIRQEEEDDGSDNNEHNISPNGLEFFLVRRKRSSRSDDEEQQSSQNKLSQGKKLSNNDNDYEENNINNNDNDNEDSSKKKEGDMMSIDSNGAATSGYGTDDEKDVNDDIEELDEQKNNEVRFSNVLVDPKAMDCQHYLPREVDVDEEGELLYHHPEHLPRRQMRVLHDGDRILMRYCSHRNNVCIMKLEYVHGQHISSSHVGRKPKRMTQFNASERGENATKPLIMSFKSADVKPYQKKGHSTSAAEAPSDDESSNAAAPPCDGGGRKRKAGEDWSAEEGGPNRKDRGEGDDMSRSFSKRDNGDCGGRKDNKINNADDGDEEYSYLTGDIVVKDQGYVSAITGDDRTSPDDVIDNGKCKKRGVDDGGDAATASAVVHTTSSPSKIRVLNDDVMKENDSDTAEDEQPAPAKKLQKQNDMDGDKPSEEKEKHGNIELEIEELGDPNAESQENYLTAQMYQESDGDDDDDENDSEEELLSQPSKPDVEETPVKFQLAQSFEEKAAKKSDSDESGSDIDMDPTQPFHLPKAIVNKTSSIQSFSTTAQEDNDDDDDDDSTKCPEQDDEDLKIPANEGNVAQQISSTSVNKLANDVPETAKAEVMDENDSENLSDDDLEATQGFPLIKHSDHHQEDDDEETKNDHEDQNGEVMDEDDKNLSDDEKEATQGFPSMKHPNRQKDDEEEEDESNIEDQNDAVKNDVPRDDNSFDGEPTQQFPLTKQGVNTTNHNDIETPEDIIIKPEEVVSRALPGSHQYGEDNEVYQAETQEQEYDVFQDETQPFGPLPINSPVKSHHSEEEVENNQDSAAAKSSSTTNSLDKERSAPQPQIEEEQEKTQGSVAEKSPTTPNPSLEEGRKAPPPPQSLAVPINSEEHVEAASPPKDTTDCPPAKSEQSVANLSAAAKDVHFDIPPTHDDGNLKANAGRKAEEDDPEPTKSSPANERAASGATFDMSQEHRLENSAVHKISSGAIMTGPVGGLPQRAHGEQPKKAQPNRLVSMALQANDTNTNALHAAASSEETTVCQMDGLVEGEQKFAQSTMQQKQQQEEEALDDRDPDIPHDISFQNETRRDGMQSNSSKVLTTPHHGKKRRSGVSSSGKRKRESHAVRIIFTGINPTQRHKQWIDDIGAKLVDSIEEAANATHVIAKDSKTKLRRTPKLMICLCKTSQILGIEWLEQSAKEQRVLDTDDFLLIGDKEAEKRYNFSMKETLQNGTLARSNTGGVLGEWFVYICKGVADNKAPSMKELHLLVEATGATFLRTLSESEVSDPTKTIMITSDPATSAQRSEKGVERVTSLGGRLLPTSWLFHTITTQQIMFSFEGEVKESAAMASKQRSNKRKAAPAMGRNTRKSSRNR